MREQVKVRKNDDWQDAFGSQYLFGFDFEKDGIWFHAARNGEPLLFETADERDEAMLAFEKGMVVDYVAPISFERNSLCWKVLQNNEVIYSNPKRTNCFIWLHERGLVIEGKESKLPVGYNVVPALG